MLSPPGNTFAPAASRIISPATSSVRSPDDKSISVPSIVMLSISTPASAVTAWENVTTPPDDIAIALDRLESHQKRATKQGITINEQKGSNNKSGNYLLNNNYLNSNR